MKRQQKIRETVKYQMNGKGKLNGKMVVFKQDEKIYGNNEGASVLTSENRFYLPCKAHIVQGKSSKPALLYPLAG